MQTEKLPVKPFDFIRRTDPARLLNVIQQEHPQTIALVLANLEPNKASVILQNLPDEMQSDVVQCIACMGRTSPQIVRKIERVLEKKLSMIPGEDYFTEGGVESVAQILNHVDRFSEKRIMEALGGKAPELAEEIKNRMFVFEDVVMLNDLSLQRVLREVDSQELALALKNADAKVQEKFFRNMSKRAAAMLHEDMEFMGPVRLIDVEYAQQKIISIIRHLEDIGEIVVARKEDELVGEHVKHEFGWDDMRSLGHDKVARILAEADLLTLAMALTLTRIDIFKKLTRPMGFFQRLGLKRAMRKLKNLSIHDVADAQSAIMAIAQKENTDD